MSINVSSLNPDAPAIFNMPNLPLGATFSSGSTAFIGTSSGYIVSPEGTIQFPMLEQLKVE